MGMILFSNCTKSSNSTPPATASTDSVLYSNWISLNMQLNGTDANGDSIYTETIPAPAITTAVFNKATIIGYIEVQDPLSGDSSVINAGLAFEEFFDIGSISLVSIGVDYSQYFYRYVIIPGKITVTDASGVVHTYTSDQLKVMSYSTLKTVLSLPAKGSSLAKPN
jgi:hypothetical protein